VQKGGKASVVKSVKGGISLKKLKEATEPHFKKVQKNLKPVFSQEAWD
jgi:hypothetical protein